MPELAGTLTDKGRGTDMYDCSQAFHDAVRAGNDQKALLLFGDCVFTDADINVDRGIDFHDCFNAEEDLSIGQAQSNEVSFSLFNDDRLLNDYGFGDFLCTLGVHIGTDVYLQTFPVILNTMYASYAGQDSYPFFLRNGAAVSVQPNFAVKAIAAIDGRVYAFSGDGRYAVYSDLDGENITYAYEMNSFMQHKSIQWTGKGIYYNRDSRILFIYDAGNRYRYEFVPLGWFHAERPNAPDMICLDLDCFDYMQRFERDMPDADALGASYPITIGRLFERMCSYVGVDYASSDFINSGAIIEEEPEDFKRVSMRDVLKWIAEAAGSNARFNRDGVLEMAWLRHTDQSYGTRNYSEFNPYWYEAPRVGKIYNRDTQTNEDQIVGGGGENYLIQDNPLLRGVS